MGEKLKLQEVLRYTPLQIGLKIGLLDSFSNLKLSWHLLGSDADVIQFHDPELLPAAILLKYLKKKTLVIFDSHEDYKKQIIGKNYLWKPFRPFIAAMVDLVERAAAKS